MTAKQTKMLVFTHKYAHMSYLHGLESE